MFNAVSALHSDLQLVVSPEGRVLSCGFRNGVLKKVSWGNSTERGHPRPVPIRRKGPKRTLLPVLRSRIVARGGPIERIRVEDRCPVSSGDLHSSFFGKAAVDCAKTVLAGSLVLLTWIQGPSQVLAQDTLTTQLSSENPVFDAAKVLPSRTRGQLNSQLQEFEQKSGWRIRVLTGYEGELSIDEDDVRAAWKPNATSVVVAFDPSSPNIVAFRFIGADVQKKLRRQFWIELQSRFGNIYYVRDEVCTGVVALLAATTHMLLLFFHAQVEGVSCVANELSDTGSLFIPGMSLSSGMKLEHYENVKTGTGSVSSQLLLDGSSCENGFLLFGQISNNGIPKSGHSTRTGRSA